MYKFFDQLEKLKQHEVYRSLANQDRKLWQNLKLCDWNISDMPRDKFTVELSSLVQINGMSFEGCSRGLYTVFAKVRSFSA